MASYPLEAYFSALTAVLIILLIIPSSIGAKHEVCHNNGTRQIHGKERICICVLPFTGRYCEDYACVNGLSTGLQYNPESPFFRKRCLCDPGWTGELCSTSLSNRCGEHGTEVLGQCECSNNFVGERCQYVTRCINGQLYNGRCACHYGWAGDFCDRIICHQGQPDESNEECICPSKYRGKYCDFCSQASSSPPPECKEIDQTIIYIDGSLGPILITLIITIASVAVIGAVCYFLFHKFWKAKKMERRSRQEKSDVEFQSKDATLENCPLHGSGQVINIKEIENLKMLTQGPPPPYETLTPVQNQQISLRSPAANDNIEGATTTSSGSQLLLGEKECIKARKFETTAEENKFFLDETTAQQKNEISAVNLIEDKANNCRLVRNELQNEEQAEQEKKKNLCAQFESYENEFDQSKNYTEKQLERHKCKSKIEYNERLENRSTNRDSGKDMPEERAVDEELLNVINPQ